MNDQRWQFVFNDYANSSFVDALRREAPHLLPGAGPRPEMPQLHAALDPVFAMDRTSVRPKPICAATSLSSAATACW